MMVALAIVGLVAIFIVAIFVRGLALSILWSWFAVPIFHLPPLSIPQAIGVSIIIGFVAHQYSPTPKGEDVNRTELFIYSLIFPLISVLIGWIVKGFM